MCLDHIGRTGSTPSDRSLDSLEVSPIPGRNISAKWFCLARFPLESQIGWMGPTWNSISILSRSEVWIPDPLDLTSCSPSAALIRGLRRGGKPIYLLTSTLNYCCRVLFNRLGKLIRNLFSIFFFASNKLSAITSTAQFWVRTFDSEVRKVLIRNAF